MKKIKVSRFLQVVTMLINSSLSTYITCLPSLGIYHLQSGYCLHWWTNLNRLFLALSLIGFSRNNVTPEHPYLLWHVLSSSVFPNAGSFVTFFSGFCSYLCSKDAVLGSFTFLFSLYSFSIGCTREWLQVEWCFHTHNFHSHYSWPLSRLPVPAEMSNWTSHSHC